jgi:hypothetical protein
MSVQSEAALITVGLQSILDASPSFGKGKQAEAAKLPATIRKLLLSALAGDKAPKADFPRFNYKQVSDQLQNTGEKQAHALLTGLPEPLADEVLADVTHVIQYLQEALPRRVTRTTAKVTVEPPEAIELGRFRRKWMVATDPLVVIRDLVDGSISPDMVEAFQALYPATYEALSPIVDDAIATMKARRGDGWDLPSSRDRALKTLLQAEPVNLDLANDYQRVAQQVQQQAPQATQSPKPLKLDTSEELPGQKSA